MMADAIFDTHRYIRNLTASGLTEEQAEAIAYGQVQVINDSLATKVDIAEVNAQFAGVHAAILAETAKIEATVRVEIAAVRTAGETATAEIKAAMQAETGRVNAEIAAVRAEAQVNVERAAKEREKIKADLLKFMFGAFIAQGGLVVGLVVGLVRFLS